MNPYQDGLMMQRDCFKPKGHKSRVNLQILIFQKMTYWLWPQYINLTKIAWEQKLF